MVRIALAVLIGLLWAGTIPVTMPWTASIFGLALLNFLLGHRLIMHTVTARSYGLRPFRTRR